MTDVLEQQRTVVHVARFRIFKSLNVISSAMTTIDYKLSGTQKASQADAFLTLKSYLLELFPWYATYDLPDFANADFSYPAI